MASNNLTAQAVSDFIASQSLYGYIPSRPIAIVFLVLFTFSTSVHLFHALHLRQWFLLPTAVLCGIGELIGWSARLWSSINPLSVNSFVMQITTTIVSPTPLLAANFIVFGRIIDLLGSRYSRLGPHLYTKVFLTCDVVALVVQAFGGGLASMPENISQAKLGGNIAFGGIVFQLACICVYITLAAEYFWRYSRDVPVKGSYVFECRDPPPEPPHLKWILPATAAMTAFLFTRSVYRTIELANGWTGPIIHTQWLFVVFDATMVILAMITLSAFHPRLLLVIEEAGMDSKLNTVKFTMPPALILLCP